MNAGSRTRAATFVLVHGSWHGAWCFNPLANQLARLGYPSILVDLPGHGLRARQRAPLAAIGLADYVDAVAGEIALARASGADTIILLGHSMSGLVITAVGERLGPGAIQALVYVSAFLPANGQTANDIIMKIPDALMPTVIVPVDPGTELMRINPRCADPDYLESARQALYHDVDPETLAATLDHLQADEPARPFGEPVFASPERYGAIPRHFVRCGGDTSIRAYAQDGMIAAADAAYPGNPTTVHRLDSASHSPFLSQPAEVAAALAQIASSAERRHG